MPLRWRGQPPSPQRRAQSGNERQRIARGQARAGSLDFVVKYRADLQHCQAVELPRDPASVSLLKSTKVEGPACFLVSVLFS
jgi:hypothetical protein